MDAKAKRLWRRITHAHPVDFFGPGSDILLENFVVMTEMMRFYHGMLKDDPSNQDYLRSVATISNVLNTTAQKLRISNSARLDKKSGIYDETDTREGDGKVLRWPERTGSSR
jgi:hypothetical protein